MRILWILLLLTSLCGYANAEEVVLGQIAYTRTDLLTKQESPGIWSFTQDAETEEVKILKYVIGSPFEKEEITPWTRITTFTSEGKLVHMRESYVFSADETASGRRKTNFGHITTTDAKTGKVLDSWPIFCTIRGSTNFYATTCKTFQSDGGLYEVTRDFFRRGRGVSPIVERRTIKDASGKVISHVVDSQTQ